MRFRPMPTLFTLLLATLLALPATAQPRKVTVGGRPAAGQTIRLNIVQDADLKMQPTQAAAGSPIGPMHLKAKTTTVVSQKVGTPDEKGAVKVEMTYEEITQDLTMNGQPAPPEAAAAATALKGKTLSMTVDAAGEVVDVTPPPDFPLPASMMKDMLKQALGLMPKQEIAVGDSITAPFAMAMPVPLPGAEPPQLKGELTSKLTGVTGEVAALEQVVSAAVDATVPGPGGSGDIAIKMQVKGSGTTDWDLKGALVHGSKMTTEINGTFTVPGVGEMQMSGTTIVSLSRLP